MNTIAGSDKRAHSRGHFEAYKFLHADIVIIKEIRERGDVSFREGRNEDISLVEFSFLFQWSHIRETR